MEEPFFPAPVLCNNQQPAPVPQMWVILKDPMPRGAQAWFYTCFMPVREQKLSQWGPEKSCSVVLQPAIILCQCWTTESLCTCSFRWSNEGFPTRGIARRFSFPISHFCPCQKGVVWLGNIACLYYQFKQCLIHLPNDGSSAGTPGYTAPLVCSRELQWTYLHITKTKDLGQNVSSLALLRQKH